VPSRQITHGHHSFGTFVFGESKPTKLSLTGPPPLTKSLGRTDEPFDDGVAGKVIPSSPYLGIEIVWLLERELGKAVEQRTKGEATKQGRGDEIPSSRFF
jgi:hypothetical protein